MIASYDEYQYYTNDISYYHSINNGHTEPYPVDLKIVNKYFNMFPHKNKTYIDVGAHIGTTIMPYSKRFERIIGYDACQNNFELLQRNIELNGINNCEIYNNGIYQKTCKGNMILHGSNSGCYYFNENEEGNILCKTLDEEMIEKNIENVDFLKIDTEGCELYVLQGAMKLIQKWKPFIQLESNHLSENLYNIKEQDIMNYLLDMGYLPFDISKKGANLFFYYPNETLNIVPKNLFCFWTGNNKMSENRIRCIEQMKQVSGVNIKLLFINDIENYMIPAFPFHPAYYYLSETHKADYLRMYFMNFFGGGYTDIKEQQCNWSSLFDKINENNELWGIGYPEIGRGGVANLDVIEHWNLLIGNGAYIFKPNTDFTKEWYFLVHQLLDNKYEELKKNPSTFPQDCKEAGRGYPIEWNEMLGRIFHFINYKYYQYISRDLICPLCSNYR